VWKLECYNSPKSRIHTWCLNHIWTNSTEQNPSWRANGFSASQEIPCIVCNLDVHYHVHKKPPLAYILCQMNPVYSFFLIFLKYVCNIIFSSTPRPSKWSLSGFLTKALYIFIYILFHACHMPCPFSFIPKLFNYITFSRDFVDVFLSVTREHCGLIGLLCCTRTRIRTALKQTVLLLTY
jgi:hypothetical protein